MDAVSDGRIRRPATGQHGGVYNIVIGETLRTPVAFPSCSGLESDFESAGLGLPGEIEPDLLRGRQLGGDGGQVITQL